MYSRLLSDGDEPDRASGPRFFTMGIAFSAWIGLLIGAIVALTLFPPLPLDNGVAEASNLQALHTLRYSLAAERFGFRTLSILRRPLLTFGGTPSKLVGAGASKEDMFFDHKDKAQLPMEQHVSTNGREGAAIDVAKDAAAGMGRGRFSPEQLAFMERRNRQRKDDVNGLVKAISMERQGVVEDASTDRQANKDVGEAVRHKLAKDAAFNNGKGGYTPEQLAFMERRDKHRKDTVNGFVDDISMERQGGVEDASTERQATNDIREGASRNDSKGVVADKDKGGYTPEQLAFIERRNRQREGNANGLVEDISMEGQGVVDDASAEGPATKAVRKDASRNVAEDAVADNNKGGYTPEQLAFMERRKNQRKQNDHGGVRDAVRERHVAKDARGGVVSAVVKDATASMDKGVYSPEQVAFMERRGRQMKGNVNGAAKDGFGERSVANDIGGDNDNDGVKDTSMERLAAKEISKDAATNIVKDASMEIQAAGDVREDVARDVGKGTAKDAFTERQVVQEVREVTARNIAEDFLADKDKGSYTPEQLAFMERRNSQRKHHGNGDGRRQVASDGKEHTVDGIVKDAAASMGKEGYSPEQLAFMERRKRQMQDNAEGDLKDGARVVVEDPAVLKAGIQVNVLRDTRNESDLPVVNPSATKEDLLFKAKDKSHRPKEAPIAPVPDNDSRDYSPEQLAFMERHRRQRKVNVNGDAKDALMERLVAKDGREEAVEDVVKDAPTERPLAIDVLKDAVKDVAQDDVFLEGQAAKDVREDVVEHIGKDALRKKIFATDVQEDAVGGVVKDITSIERQVVGNVQKDAVKGAAQDSSSLEGQASKDVEDDAAEGVGEIASMERRASLDVHEDAGHGVWKERARANERNRQNETYSMMGSQEIQEGNNNTAHLEEPLKEPARNRHGEVNVTGTKQVQDSKPIPAHRYSPKDLKNFFEGLRGKPVNSDTYTAHMEESLKETHWSRQNEAAKQVQEGKPNAAHRYSPNDLKKYFEGLRNQPGQEGRSNVAHSLDDFRKPWQAPEIKKKRSPQNETDSIRAQEVQEGDNYTAHMGEMLKETHRKRQSEVNGTGAKPVHESEPIAADRTAPTNVKHGFDGPATKQAQDCNNYTSRMEETLKEKHWSRQIEANGTGVEEGQEKAIAAYRYMPDNQQNNVDGLGTTQVQDNRNYNSHMEETLKETHWSRQNDANFTGAAQAQESKPIVAYRYIPNTTRMQEPSKQEVHWRFQREGDGVGSKQVQESKPNTAYRYSPNDYDGSEAKQVQDSINYTSHVGESLKETHWSRQNDAKGTGATQAQDSKPIAAYRFIPNTTRMQEPSKQAHWRFQRKGDDVAAKQVPKSKPNTAHRYSPKDLENFFGGQIAEPVQERGSYAVHSFEDFGARGQLPERAIYSAHHERNQQNEASEVNTKTNFAHRYSPNDLKNHFDGMGANLMQDSTNNTVHTEVTPKETHAIQPLESDGMAGQQALESKADVAHRYSPNDLDNYFVGQRDKPVQKSKSYAMHSFDESYKPGQLPERALYAAARSGGTEEVHETTYRFNTKDRKKFVEELLTSQFNKSKNSTAAPQSRQHEIHSYDDSD